MDDPIQSEPMPNLTEKTPDEQPPPYTYVSSENVPHTSTIPNPSVNPLNREVSPNNSQSSHAATNSSSYKWPRHSITAKCPSCGMTVKTQAETSVTGITLLISLLLLLICFILAFIPFCISACKKTIHYCPNCGYIIGKRNEFE